MSARRGKLGTREWRILRLQCFQRDDYACCECGSRARLECDHVIPVDAGGTDDLANLQTLCRDCHIVKTRREAREGDPIDGQEEWARHLQASPQKRRQALLWGR